MTRHFQGPWRVGEQNGNGHWVIRHKRPAIKIATVPWCGNARLIAAAPDLLAALENVVDAIPRVLRDEGLLTDISDLIERATGNA